MKKTSLTLGVSTALACCTLAFATTGQGTQTQLQQLLSSSPEPASAGQSGQSVNNSKRDKVALGSFDLKIAGGELARLALQAPGTGAQPGVARVQSAAESNMVHLSGDMWDAETTAFYPSSNATFDADTRTLTFSGQETQAPAYVIGGTKDGNYKTTQTGAVYRFSGKISCDGDSAVVVLPCIFVVQDNSLYIADNSVVRLSEDNSFAAEFSVTTPELDEGMPIIAGFISPQNTQGITFTATDNTFGYDIYTLRADKWTPETDKPGLGITGEYADRSYTLACADGVTTLGLYHDSDGTLCVSGVNTTADTLSVPHDVMIDGVVKRIKSFGTYLNAMDWSGAQSLTTLEMMWQTEMYAQFDGSAVTDVYANGICEVLDPKGTENVYLHLPYGSTRSNYSYMGFRRILIGDEQPWYPVPANTDSWVLAGVNDGDFFSVSLRNGDFSVEEIFTQADKVTLPLSTPYSGGGRILQALGAENNMGRGALCAHAPNLKSVYIPEHYRSIYVNWSSNPITDVYMHGANVPNTYWSLLSTMSVHVDTPEAYTLFGNSSSWNRANIEPEGWEFEWLPVNVSRKGEFAQTYIEMTDADWSKGVNVKIIGELNANDLNNIKQLTSLQCLDLSDATFDALPSSCFSYMSTLREVALPSAVKTIPSSAFYSCAKLRKLTAPGVDRVESSALYGCSRLVDFDIKNITYIGNDAFNGCTSFCPAVLSPELAYLGSSAFRSTAIVSMAIPEGQVNLGSSVFYNCGSLQSVTLPSTLKTIGNSAFGNCVKLAGIDIPERVTTIGSSAFYGCTSLAELTIPSNVETIGGSALYGCSALTSVKCKSIVPPVANSDFTSGVDMNHCTLYVAPFTIDAYRAANNWSNFYIMKPLNEPVKNIYVNRPITFDLQSADNAVLQDNPNMTLDYRMSSPYNVGQLSASGDGTLSAGVFAVNAYVERRYGGYNDMRPSLVNNADNMRADSVVCSLSLEKNTWHFISFQYDVQMSDIEGLNGTDFVIRQYNSAKRADGKAEAAGAAGMLRAISGGSGTGDGTVTAESNWEDVPADGMLEAGKGYIIQAANNATNANGNTYDAVVRFPSRNTVTKNRMFTSADAVVPLQDYPAEFAHNRSWNLVGNPYPCYYDMHALKDDFYTPIVLWRGTGYQAYSPVDDDIILRPNEAFFVQRPLEAEQMVFGAEGRMHYSEATSSDKTPGTKVAPANVVAASRAVFNFTVEGCGSDNRARIVINDAADMGYEAGRDAAKFFAGNPVGAEIFVRGDVDYDICERPLADGTATLGMRLAGAGQYTLRLDGRGIQGWTVILTDRLTGISTALNGNVYVFSAEAGIDTGRFTLSFKAPEATSIDEISAAEGNSRVRVVGIDGTAVFEGTVVDFRQTAPAGVYVVVAEGKTYKTVIK